MYAGKFYVLMCACTTCLKSDWENRSMDIGIHNHLILMCAWIFDGVLILLHTELVEITRYILFSIIKFWRLHGLDVVNSSPELIIHVTEHIAEHPLILAIIINVKISLHF